LDVSSTNAAHLLIAVAAVDLGLEANALGHGVGELSKLHLSAITGRAKHWTNIDLAVLEETTAQDSVGGEAQAVAGRAKRRGHRADEPDASARSVICEMINIGRTYTGFAGSIDRHERTKLRFDPRADFCFRNEGILPAILRPASTGRTEFRRID
jgi:hypothetical protein